MPESPRIIAVVPQAIADAVKAELARRKKANKKTNKSQLVSEALGLLLGVEYTPIKAGNPLAKRPRKNAE